MKKRLKNKSSFVPHRAQPDITGLILKIQQQLTFLERKIDTLIGQSPGKPLEREHHPKSFQRPDHYHRQGEAKQSNNYRERILHKAVCADCNKECEVPFRPSQDRPVYCRDCFSKRKVDSSFKGKDDFRSRGAGPAQVSHIDKPHGGEKKKRRKARA
ncbi:MAG: hypothetical protein NTW09_05325 [Candidatus Omnitrophica bacterium]|nr:hypothetical protein [Candidatus Omnitrophota bacterium]